MVSFLDQMAGSIYAGFKGKLRSGVIVRSIAGGVDDHGRPFDAVNMGAALEGFPEDYSEYFRAQNLIPATDLKVNIFGASIPGLEPTKNDLVRLDYPAANGHAAYSQWYQLRSADTDPAKALWVCRAYPIPSGPDDFNVDLAALLAALAELVNDDLPDGP